METVEDTTAGTGRQYGQAMNSLGVETSPLATKKQRSAETGQRCGHVTSIHGYLLGDSQLKLR